jgi:hypothetical protein
MEFVLTLASNQSWNPNVIAKILWYINSFLSIIIYNKKEKASLGLAFVF